MKKTFKMVGIAAVAVALICNLEYSLFFSVKDSPNAAKASWTSVDTGHSTTTMFCGTEPDRTWWLGDWYGPVFDSYVTSQAPSYSSGFWYFIPSNSGSMCGLNSPSYDTGFRWQGQWEITNNVPSLVMP